MSKIIDQVRAALHARADVNGDGKVTRTDIEEVARTIALRADTSVRKFPWGGVIAGLIIGVALGYTAAKLFH